MKISLFSVVYMFLITLVFTSIVGAVKLLSEERIERNQKAKLQKIILKVLTIPTDVKITNEALIRLFENRVRSIRVQGRTLYVGYEADGRKLTGYAFPVGGPGFWGPIYGMVAVDSSGSVIKGIAFYKHSETPGLGGRLTEDWFTEQFAGLPIFPVAGDKKIFYLKPEGSGQAPNELDAITGATGTSRAVQAFLNRELDLFLKRLWQPLKKAKIEVQRSTVQGSRFDK
ncbi:FMN-binding protein [Thermodesulfobacteriota bacterium]